MGYSECKYILSSIIQDWADDSRKVHTDPVCTREKKNPCNSWLTVSEVILSAFAGDLAVVDGVDGTMVIAAETTCAAVIIFPFGCFVKLYVADRAYLRTFATVDADIGIDGKFLVGDHEAVEICSDDVAEGPWSES